MSPADSPILAGLTTSTVSTSLADAAAVSHTEFTVVGTVVVLGGLFAAVYMCLRLLRTRQLTMAYAMVWLGAFAGAALLVAAPPLLHLVGRLLGTPDDLGALRLLAIATIAGFLVFFSVKISVLTHRLEDLAQRVGLMEFSLRQSIAEPRNGASMNVQSVAPAVLASDGDSADPTASTGRANGA